MRKQEGIRNKTRRNLNAGLRRQRCIAPANPWSATSQHPPAPALLSGRPRRSCGSGAGEGVRSGSDPGRQPTYRWLCCRRGWGPHFSIGSAVVSQPSLVTVTTYRRQSAAAPGTKRTWKRASSGLPAAARRRRRCRASRPRLFGWRSPAALR